MLAIDLDQLESILVIGGLLLVAGVAASKLSSRLGVPALLLFLGLGMLAGSEGLGGIAFDDPRIAQAIGTVALAFILFSGGFDTRWSDVRPVVPAAVLLATVGVAITAGVTGLTAFLVLGVPLETGLLVGAIVSSTDAAAVFAVLRSRSVGLKGRLRPLLEMESGSNDPMAILLTVALIEWITGGNMDLGSTVALFAQQLLVGLAGGVAFALLLVWGLRRVYLEQQGLYPIIVLATVALCYSSTALVGGSGFLAVYVAGLIIGNADIAHKRRLTEFGDAVAWFMQITLFLVLGLLVFPSQLLQVSIAAVVVLLALTFLGRPLAVAICLPRGWSIGQRGLVAWVGLRGAAPILLATFPLVAGIENSSTIFDVVFFVVLLSVLLQGSTIPTVARWLRVDAPLAPAEPLSVEAVHQEGGELELVDFTVGADALAAGKRIVELDLPDKTLIVVLGRGDERVIPQGSTEVQAGDRLVVLTSPADAGDLHRILTGRTSS